MKNFTVSVTDGIVAVDTPFAKSYKAKLKYNPQTFIESDNTKYNSEISRLGILLSADIYAHCSVAFENENTPVEDVLTMYRKLEFSDAQYVELKKEDYAEDKNDLTSAVFAHKEYVVNEKKYSIIFAVIRGTDGTFEQWYSNIDLGPSPDFTGQTPEEKKYFEKTGNHSDWKNRFNHKGLDVAANRIDEKLKKYLEIYTENLTAEKILFITGHSRGAGIANILGAEYEKCGVYKTFTYTYGGPRATSFQGGKEKVKTVFNLVNTDDIVPVLAATQWGFTNYGTDICFNVEDFKKQWKEKVGVKYKSAYKFLMNQVKDIVAWQNKLSETRSDFCLYKDCKKNILRKFSIFHSKKYFDFACAEYGIEMFVKDLSFNHCMLKGKLCPGFIIPLLAAVVSLYTQAGMKNAFKILKFYSLFLPGHKSYTKFCNTIIASGSFLTHFSLQRSHSITSYLLITEMLEKSQN